MADLAGTLEVADRLKRRLRASIVGRDEVIDLVVVALLADGHVLLEDFPGSGKTTLAKALGDCLVAGEGDPLARLRRIQFTPDLLPSDITGTTVFDPGASRFDFRPGPIFAHIVLADEINRTSPKVQSALLEAMGEKQVTVDNATRPLDDLFFVIATQNPLDLAGTFPLPVAQLDRFLFKIRMTHIAPADELRLLMELETVHRGGGDELPRVSREEILEARAGLAQVNVAKAVHQALVDFAEATRRSDRCLQGVSTRSLVLILPALRAHAAMAGRDYVGSDDLEALAPYVFAHRLTVAPGGGKAADVVAECLGGAVDRLARATL